MRCHVYRSPRRAETYLYLPRADDFDAVPEPLRQMFGTPEFVLAFDLHPQRTLARANAADVIRSLNAQGFYLQLPPVHPAVERAGDVADLR
ncbi:MAG: YcgL domain-containing protein [Thiotrichales bacterium]